METAYLHVVINHLPIMGVPIGLGLLLLGWWTRSEAIKHAALLVFAVLGAATIAVYAAGQGGEDFVEHLPGVSEDAIEAHEEMAGLALGVTLALGLLSFGLSVAYGGLALLMRRTTEARPLPAIAMGLVLLVAAGDAAVLGLTGKLGGRIRHTEFIDGQAVVDADGERDDDRGRGRGRGGRD